MPKALTVFLLLLSLLLCLSGCAAPASDPLPEETGTFPYTFTDSTGCQITLDAPPQRAAVLFSSYAEIWTLSGGTVAMTVGDSVARGFCSQDVPLADAGAGLKLDAEAVIASQPDFILASADLSAQTELCRQARDLGIPAAAFTVETFDDYLRLLKICTDLTKTPEAYETYGLQVQSRIQDFFTQFSAFRQTLDAEPSVLFLRAGAGASSTKAKTAKDHFVGKMLEELQVRNIADDAGELSESLSLEKILTDPPDTILIVTQGDEAAAESYIRSLFQDPVWQRLDAVRQERYYFLSKDLFHYKPNARWDQSYLLLAQLLYPEFTYE